MFHDRYNYYVDGIHVENLILPTKWYERTYLETIELQDECGQCVAVRFLAPADAVAAKIKAGRRKDIIFIQELKDSGLINDDEVLNSIYDLPISFQEAEKLWEMYDNIKKLPNQGRTTSAMDGIRGYKLKVKFLCFHLVFLDTGFDRFLLFLGLTRDANMLQAVNLVIQLSTCALAVVGIKKTRFLKKVFY